eukprot:Selendium_serpulae@DN4697_c0_g1_i3.p1
MRKDYTCIRYENDFYLSGLEQDALAAKFPNNPLLKFRGNAGSHDLKLVNETLDALSTLKEGDAAPIPFYDKSLRKGRGDRAPRESWPQIRGPVDIVFVEGWMFGLLVLFCIAHHFGVGFEALDENNERLKNADVNVVEINRLLKAYNQWHSKMQAWIVVGIDDINVVFRWRKEQEKAMKQSGKQGLTDEEVQDFVARFMPAYDLYIPGIRNTGPEGCRSKPLLNITVNSHRQPTVDAIF